MDQRDSLLPNPKGFFVVRARQLLGMGGCALVLALSGCEPGSEKACEELESWAVDCGAVDELSDDVVTCETDATHRGSACLEKWLEYVQCMEDAGCAQAHTCTPPAEHELCT